MADELIRVHVWIAEDGSITAVGRLLAGNRHAQPIPTERQSVKTAMVRADLLESTRALRLNRDTGELEATE
jgi:hypothetical protein